MTSGGKRKPANADRGAGAGRGRPVLMPRVSLLVSMGTAGPVPRIAWVIHAGVDGATHGRSRCPVSLLVASLILVWMCTATHGPGPAGPGRHRDRRVGADGYLLGTPANLGYMSGALKHFLDQIYYPCLEATMRRPYGLYVHGDSDTAGAVRAVEAITRGLGWRRAQA